MADEELIALAKREIAHIGLVGEADVLGACVVRQPKAYPVHDEDYRDNVAMVGVISSSAIRRCISSVATACTSTTTRIMP